MNMNENVKEINAKGAVGFLLHSPLENKTYFRVYENGDFKDYDIMCEELEVEIKSEFYSFYTKQKENILDFSSIAKGKN